MEKAGEHIFSEIAFQSKNKIQKTCHARCEAQLSQWGVRVHLLNGSPSIQCDACQSAVSAVIAMIKAEGQRWDDGILSTQLIWKPVEEVGTDKSD